MSKTRRFFLPQNKVVILRKHFLEGVPVSEICKQLDLNPVQFYNWQRELFENGHLAFRTPKQDPKTARLESEIAKLRAKLEQKNEVLAELMEEHVKLKKNLGRSEGGLGLPRNPGPDRRFPGAEDARRVIQSYVNEYNHSRLHAAIGYVAPADRIHGLDAIIRQKRDEKLQEARELRRERRQAAHQATMRQDNRIDFALLRRTVRMANVLEALVGLEHYRGSGPQRRGPCPIHVTVHGQKMKGNVFTRHVAARNAG